MENIQTCALTAKCTVPDDAPLLHFEVTPGHDVHRDVLYHHLIDVTYFFRLKSTLEHFYKRKYINLKKGLKGVVYKGGVGNAVRSAVVLPPVVRARPA